MSLRNVAKRMGRVLTKTQKAQKAQAQPNLPPRQMMSTMSMSELKLNASDESEELDIETIYSMVHAYSLQNELPKYMARHQKKMQMYFQSIHDKIVAARTGHAAFAKD